MLHVSIGGAQHHVEQTRAAGTVPTFYEGYGFLVTGLELVNALVVALGQTFQSLMAMCAEQGPVGGTGVTPSCEFILSAIIACAELPEEIGFEEIDARFTSFALVGDMASSTPSLLYPILAPGAAGAASRMVQMLVLSLNPTAHNMRYANCKVVNNALWCIGEVAMQLMASGGGSELFTSSMATPPWWGEALRLIAPSVAHLSSLGGAAATSIPAIDAALCALTMLLRMENDLDLSMLLENFAITLGRLALIDALAPRVAAYLPLMLIPWVRVFAPPLLSLRPRTTPLLPECTGEGAHIIPLHVERILLTI